MVNISIAAWNKCIFETPYLAEWNLTELFKMQGVNLVPISENKSDFHIEIDHYLFSSHNRTKFLNKKNRILIALEPKTVNPLQHKKFIRNYYGKVFVMHPMQRILKTDQVLKMGSYDLNKAKNTLEDAGTPSKLYGICMANGNKFSFVNQSLYKKRVDYIKFYTKNKINCWICGYGWNEISTTQYFRQLKSILRTVKLLTVPNLNNFTIPLKRNKYLNLSGYIEDHYSYYQQFKFALVIENDPNYVSEKLFAALICGNVPLYVGGSLTDLQIPEELVVRLPTEPSFDSIRILGNLETNENVLMAGSKWIRDEKNLNYWSYESGFGRLVSQVSQYIKSINSGAFQ